MLNQIYEEIKGDIGYFVKLYISAKVAGMGVPRVNRLLMIANNDLPAVELRYERLKKEAATLEYEKENSAREFQQVNNQRIMMSKTLDSTRLDCEKEMERLRHLQQQRMKQEALVKHFENNNEEYINIVKTIKDKVHNTLSDVKVFLQLALLSLTESMRYDPDKYSSLIYYNSMSSTKDNSNQHYSLYMHRQQQPPPYDYDFEDCKAILLDEAEKLFSSITKRMVDEVINEIVSKASSSSSSSVAASLPMLPSEQQP